MEKVKVCVSRQRISNWENNKNHPDIKSLLLLSSFFDVSPDVLVKGDLEEKKEKVAPEDVRQLKQDSTVFSILLLATMLLLVPSPFHPRIPIQTDASLVVRIRLHHAFLGLKRMVMPKEGPEGRRDFIIPNVRLETNSGEDKFLNSRQWFPV